MGSIIDTYPTPGNAVPFAAECHAILWKAAEMVNGFRQSAKPHSLLGKLAETLAQAEDRAPEISANQKVSPVNLERQHKVFWSTCQDCFLDPDVWIKAGYSRHELHHMIDTIRNVSQDVETREREDEARLDLHTRVKESSRLFGNRKRRR